MTQNRLAAQEPDTGERPSPAAHLKITARRLGTAEGTVPPGEARHFIAAFGILGCVITGIAGAGLTLRGGSELITLALAELALAFAGALLIAMCGRERGRRKEGNTAGSS